MANFPALLAQNPALKGLNVTIPYKQTIIPLLDELDDTANRVGAVNCIKILQGGHLKGYNTDVIGFEQSLLLALSDNNLRLPLPNQAVILGAGGAAKAVAYVLQKLNVPFQVVSRNPGCPNEVSYTKLNEYPTSLIINTTPLGTYPNVQEMPPIPLEILKPGILIFDLVYNPAETLLLREAKARGCFVQHGLEMLHLQAEAAWEIWQT